jgi:endogenous inhibitor of DNA gyrase (YacG/DUF329 family)
MGVIAKRKERVKEIAVSFIRRIRLEEKICPVCGKKFEGVRKRKYCSRACQAKADYERHAEEYRQARMEKYYAKKKVAAKK